MGGRSVTGWCLVGRPESGKNIDAFNAVFLRDVLFRGGSKRVVIPTNFYVNETDFFKYFNELCFQQSTGDSASPEVNVAFGSFGKNAFHDNIGIVEASPRL